MWEHVRKTEPTVTRAEFNKHVNQFRVYVSSSQIELSTHHQLNQRHFPRHMRQLAGMLAKF